MTFAARVLQDPSQPIGELILAGGSTPPAYPIFQNGFGQRFANIVLPAGATDAAFNYNKTAVAFTFNAISEVVPNIGISVYNWSSTGFGTKYSDPASPPRDIYNKVRAKAVAFSPLSTNQSITMSVSETAVQYEYQRTWQWDDTTGFITYYSLPSSPLTIVPFYIQYSPAGNAIAFVGFGGISDYKPPIQAYKWSYSTGFGTKYATPAGLVNQNGYGLAFTPSGNAIAFYARDSQKVFVYAWTHADGFGAKYADPANPPPTSGSAGINGIAFSPAGNAIALAHSISPYISVYEWNSSTGFGAKYADPAALPAGSGQCVAFSDSGNYIAVGHDNSPYVSVYPWNSSTGFGTKFVNPSSLPTALPLNILWRGG